MYDQYHPLAYDTGRGGKLVGSLSAYEAFWWGLGLFLSYQAWRHLPSLPLGGFVFAYLHYFLPLGICLILAYSRHGGTGTTLPRYLWLMWAFRHRTRTFTYQKMMSDER